MRVKHCLLPILLLASSYAYAEGESRHRSDAHAPAGVMGDHRHAKGDWMFSYRYMRMEMDGNRDDTDDLTPAEVLAQGYMATPLKMTTDMHMFGAMYASNDQVTVMAMLPLVDKSMDHLNAMGDKFTTESDGAGDLKLQALMRLLGSANENLHLHLGVSVPTGSIDEKGVIPTPMGPRKVRLPYPMQLGSGTWDMLAGLTYTYHLASWSWGAQGTAVKPLASENDNGYSLGNQYQMQAWAACLFGQQLSGSLRLAVNHWSDIEGADPELDPSMVPTADPELRSGERADIGLGLNWLGGSGHRLAVELILPAYQNLDGPQLKSEGMVVLGWQKAF